VKHAFDIHEFYRNATQLYPRSLPNTAAECQAAMGLSSVAFWRGDLAAEGAATITDLGGLSQTLNKYGAPVQRKRYFGRVGIQNAASGDTYTIIFSDTTFNPGTTSFMFAWSGGLISDATGTQHTALGRTNNGNVGWLIYFNDSGDLLCFFNDGAGHSVVQTIASAVCPVGSAPIDIVGQVDWSAGGSPIFRIRWSRNGINLGSAQYTLTGITTLAVASAEFGFGGVPGVIASGQTDGSGCWWRFGALAKGVQTEGATRVLVASQGLGFEPSYRSTDILAIPVGDSITVGVGDENSRGGYRSVLRSLNARLRLLGSQNTGGYERHEGESGNTIAVMRARVVPVIPMQGASTILLLAGTNDISAARDPTTQVLPDLLSFAEALKAISGIAHVLVSKLPTRAVGDANKAPTDLVNAGMAATFASATSGIVVVDAYSMITFSNPNQVRRQRSPERLPATLRSRERTGHPSSRHRGSDGDDGRSHSRLDDRHAAHLGADAARGQEVHRASRGHRGSGRLPCLGRGPSRCRVAPLQHPRHRTRRRAGLR
jgi:hypothetical protein